MHRTSTGHLQTLAARYTKGLTAPPGELFHRAFRRHIKANRQSLLDITLAVTTAQMTLEAGADGVDPLLLKAIRDTNPGLDEVRLFQLSDEEQLGAVNAAKGKYFEYLVVEKLNNGEQVGPVALPDGYRAELADSFTQPGWDLRIVDGHGAAADYLQLKATASASYIKEALERYPDIQILTTHEVGDSQLVVDSGLSNEHLDAKVHDAVQAVDASVSESFLDYFNPLIPLIAIAAREGYKVAVGRESLDGFKLSIARRGQRVVAAKLAGAAVYSLGGGVLCIPAAFAGGLWFDHTINKTAIATAFGEHRRRLLALRLYQQERLLEAMAR